ncbi:MAG TPA: hypothetical protein ENK74_03225, partial [Nitratifractor sp.]|nr:hypothetical protein [Nitratifractor sp.]
MQKNKLIKTLDIIANRVNPPYQKEIINLKDLAIPLQNRWKELNPSFTNLRGFVEIGEELNYCDTGYKKIDNINEYEPLKNLSFSDSIGHIEKINNSLFAIASGKSIFIVDIKTNRELASISASN